MIQKQLYKTRKDGVNLYVTFSDESWKIRKINPKSGREEIYDQAVDIEGVDYEYEEIDEKIMHTVEETLWMEDNGKSYYIR